MTGETPSESAEKAAREELLRRASEAGLEAETLELETGAQDEPTHKFAKVYFPNGRRTRGILASGTRVHRLLATEFEKVTFLGDYDAFADRQNHTIEARVSAAEPSPRFGPWVLPGTEVLDESSSAEDEQEDPDLVLLSRRNAPNNWRLRVVRDDQFLELSPVTDLAQAIFGGPQQSRAFTLKVSGVHTDRHDEMLDMLEGLGNAFLFELDVLYGASYSIRRRRTPSRRVKQELSTKPPKFPRNHYSDQALALYQYARAATGLPLLAFLAYYQSVEFFFPVFAKEQTVRSLRTALMNPRFDPTDDSSVNRLITLAAPASRVGLGEKEQLRATVRACVEADELLAFIQSSEEITDHFCTKKQSIRGVQPIRLQGDQMDIRDQVSDRIYAIRCRVVHTKEDGGTPGTEILLPSSHEADSLGADIELVRLVAQRALSARASRS